MNKLKHCNLSCSNGEHCEHLTGSLGAVNLSKAIRLISIHWEYFMLQFKSLQSCGPTEFSENQWYINYNLSPPLSYSLFIFKYLLLNN